MAVYFCPMASSSSICYGLISRDRVVLCDRRLVNGSFESTCQEVLENVLKTGGNKFSFDSGHGQHVYHAYVSGNLIFVCVTEAMFDRNVAFNCLFELERQLISVGLMERAQSATPYGLRGSFSSCMQSVLLRYSSNDKLGQLESKVDEVSGIMRHNIDKVVHRGEALDDLTERSDLLAHSSTDFRQSATKLRKKLCWKNFRLWVILTIIVIILIAIVLVIIIATLAAKGTFNKKNN